MKYLAHVPVEQFGFISVETETAEEAASEYALLKDKFSNGGGIGIEQLADVLVEYIKSGGIVDGGNYDFSLYEKNLLGQMKKKLKAWKDVKNDANMMVEAEKN